MYKVLISGRATLDYLTSTYISIFLKENNFEITDDMAKADFIYIDETICDSPICIINRQMSMIYEIELAEIPNDLLRLRDESEFRESEIR